MTNFNVRSRFFARLDAIQKITSVSLALIVFVFDLHNFGFLSLLHFFRRNLQIVAIDVKRRVYAVERNAVHPIAKAILAYSQNNLIGVARLRDFKAIPGYGLEAIAETYTGDKLTYIGSPDYILSKLPSPTSCFTPLPGAGSSPGPSGTKR